MTGESPPLPDVLDQPSALSGVLRKYGATWQIVHDAGVGVWTAVQRPTPTALRVICAYDLASLAAKLDATSDRGTG
jgi:low affinity Fe/Cu permease